MPLRDDYIQRTIEQIAQVLRYLLGQRDERAFEQLMQELDGAYDERLGSSRRLIRRLGSEELLATLSTTGQLDRERAYLMGVLLAVEAQALEARNRPVPPALRQKALDLLLAAAAEGLDVDELDGRILDLQHALRDVLLPEATLWRVFEYRVRRGGYAGAEDLLFEILERFGDDSTRRERARGYYAWLDRRSDAELERGGLPRPEVREGRAALEALLTRLATLRT